MKKYLFFTIMIALFGGCMWLIFAPSGSDKDADKQGGEFNSDIPDPRGATIVGDKKTAYEQDQLRERQQEQMQSLQDYSYMMGATDENSEQYQRQLKMAPIPPDYQEQLNASNGYSSGYSSRRGNSFDASGSAHSDLTSTLGNFFEEPSEDPEKEELRAEIESLKNMVAQGQNQSSTLDEQMVLLEKSFELAARYNPSGVPQPEVQEEPQGGSPGRKTKVESVTQVKRSVVSSLDRPMSDAEFIEHYSQQRNWGFNTIAATEAKVEKNTIAAVVHGDQVLVDGQSVRLRTTEPMRVGVQLIPRNTIITGIAKIMGERLEIAISSIEFEGSIIPVEMMVYDSDGQQGIYIPGSMEIAALKEIAGNMGQSMGTTINLNRQSASEQLLTDLGRGTIQSTSQYISKKAKQVKVTLKAGYRIFLLPSTTV